MAAIRKLVGGAGWYHEVLKEVARYVVLDALICNTDRHHENWGFLTTYKANDAGMGMSFGMTPSFDHASSLGRELRDEKASEILAKNGIEGYARRAHGGIYWKQSDRRGANPLDLVELASGKFPEYFREPIAGVAAIPVKNLLDIVDEVPNLRISAPSRRFAQALLTRFELKGLSKQCDPIGGKRCLSQTLLNSLYIHAHWRLYT